MNTAKLTAWLSLSENIKKGIFEEINKRTSLPTAAIEKDWWVVHTLALVFEMSCAKNLVFKGGTSLSKAWNLITRFSEDIDLALDRTFLGFDVNLNNTQIKKLRKASFAYITGKFLEELKDKFIEAGLFEIEIQLAEIKDKDQDPMVIEIYYPSIVEKSDYIKPRVLLEIGCRSLIEPNTIKSFSTIVAEYFGDRLFADIAISISTVNPERTFLEKIFLLHEEFQKPIAKIRTDRLTRHLYDIEKLMDTDFAQKALSDQKLFDDIVAHRKLFTPIRGIDYGNHTKDKINPIPPIEIIDNWRKDYKTMQESMIYGESLPFLKLIERLEELKQRLKNSITINMPTKKNGG